MSDTYQMQMILPAARRADPITSHMAGANVQIRVGTQRWKLLKAFCDFSAEGLTDEQAAISAGLVDLRGCCWWKRCSELRELGMIKPTGEKRLSTVGEYRQVCKVTELGLSQMETNQ